MLHFVCVCVCVSKVTVSVSVCLYTHNNAQHRTAVFTRQHNAESPSHSLYVDQSNISQYMNAIQRRQTHVMTPVRCVAGWLANCLA
jgi:hypothetical protein